MSFGTLTVDNITDMFVCKLCSCINAYPFNIYSDSDYNDIMEYQAEKRSAIEFEKYFEA